MIAISMTSMVVPVNCGIVLSPGPEEAQSILTLDVCSKGGAAMTASNAIPCVAQAGFVLNRLHPNAYDLADSAVAIQSAYLEGLAKPAHS